MGRWYNIIKNMQSKRKRKNLFWAVFTAVSLLILSFPEVDVFSVGQQPPSPPSNARITVVSSTSIRLDWADNSDDENYFQIQRSVDGSSYSNAGTVGANNTSSTDTGLSVNAKYWYRVKACKNALFEPICSGWAYAENNPKYTLANKPVIDYWKWDWSSNEAQGQWSTDHNDGNPDGTEYFAKDALTGLSILEWASDKTWNERPCGTFDKAFQLCVKARNGDGVETGETCSDVVNGYCRINTPTNIHHTGNTVSSIDWQWDAVPSYPPVSGYEFYKKDGSNYIKVGTKSCSVEGCSEGGSVNWTWTGLSPNSSYTIYIRAVHCDSNNNCNGESAYGWNDSPVYTSIESATGHTCSATPNSITITADGTFTNLTSGSSGIYFESNSGHNSGWLQTTSWTDIGLLPGSTYVYYITTRNGDGDENAKTGPYICTTLAEGGGGPTGTCETESDLCKVELYNGTWYYCTNAGGSYAWRTSSACDDSNECTYGDKCVVLVSDQGSCVGSYYCGNNDNSCGCTSCENCNNDDGWYDTGNTRWVTDPNNQCQEKEQDKWEYRDFYCYDYSCTYSVTDTNWVDTGAEPRSKDDNTPCTGGTCNVCCSGSCTAPACCTDSDCDEGQPGVTYTCLNAGTCDAECHITPGEWPDLIVQDISWSPSGTVSAGQSVNFSVTIKNRGNSGAGSSVVKYYVDGSYIGQDSIVGVPQGSTETAGFSWTATCGHSHSVKAVADANNAVAESNEGNNERAETINVANCPPNAPTLSGPTTGTVGQTYNFTASATDPDGDDVKYGFDWGDDTSYTTNYVSSGTSQTASHSWSEAGVYNVCVVAGDSDVWSESTCQAINISEGEPPEQGISADFSFCLKQDTTSTVKFTDLSTDSLGTIDSWQWDFGDGGSSSEQNPEHTYSSASGLTTVFSDDFNDGDYDGWTLVKLNSNYCHWSISSNAFLREKSDSCNSIMLAPYYSLADSYTISSKAQTSGNMNDAVAIVFGYIDENDYYMFSWNDPSGYYENPERALVHWVNGNQQILARDTGITMADRTWYDLEVSVSGGQIRAKVNGSLILTAGDAPPLNQSGVYSVDNDGARGQGVLLDSRRLTREKYSAPER